MSRTRSQLRRVCERRPRDGTGFAQSHSSAELGASGIAARALLGIAGRHGAVDHVVDPESFPRPEADGVGDRNLGDVFLVGALIGPLVGGAMLEHFWWGSVFLLGVPAMLLLHVVHAPDLTHVTYRVQS